MNSEVSEAARDLASVALEAADREEWRLRCLAALGGALSADLTYIATSDDGSHTIISGRGDPEIARLAREIDGYGDEMRVAEMKRAVPGVAMLDESLFSDRRKAQLRLYTEHMHPLGVRGYLLCMWFARHRLHYVIAARPGARWRFDERELHHVEALVPVIALGEALHAERPMANEDRLACWLHDNGVGREVSRVVELACRGFTNAEIATALGKSAFTVRNQLAAAYAKLDVASRSELLWRSTCDSPRQPEPPRGASLERFVREGRTFSSNVHAPRVVANTSGVPSCRP